MDRKTPLRRARSTGLFVARRFQSVRTSVLDIFDTTSIHRTARVSLRAELATNEGEISIGKQTTIFPHAKILPHTGSVSIGDHSTVNPFTILYGQGGLTIGDAVRIAAHTTIIPSNHRFSDPDELIHTQGLTKEGIVIEDDVWIGTGCRILDGVTIGEGSVIGAGAVVTESIPPYSVAVGVPAEVRGKRE